MKHNILIKSIEYILKDEDKSKTKCVIRWINPITGSTQVSIGVAKYNPKDIHNVVKGRRISESRAKINMWHAYLKSLTGFYIESVKKYHKLIYREKYHTKALIDDTNKNNK